MLSVGEKAPNFEAKTAAGRDLTLSALRLNGSVVLIFLRFIGCPLTRLRARELFQEYSRFYEHDMQLYLVVESDPIRVSQYAEQKHLPDFFIPDPQRKLFDQYDVKPGPATRMLHPAVLAATFKALINGHFHGKFEGNEFQLPATFVINSQGVLDYVHYGVHPADNAPLEEICRAC